jgi:hypothetical protein
MTVITDSKKRVTIPARPGSRFDVQIFGQDKFILTRLEPAPSKPARVTLTKQAGFSVGRMAHKINEAALTEALKEFP